MPFDAKPERAETDVERKMKIEDGEQRPTLRVGDKLWYVPRERRDGDGREVTVAKIGRRWATMEGAWPLRIDMETLAADGGEYSSPGSCFASREAYEAYIALVAAWGDFVMRLTRWRPPAGVDLEWIEAARVRLGLPQ